MLKHVSSGVHLVLTLSCLKANFKRDKRWGAYYLILWVLATIGLGLQISQYQVAFFDHRDDPGGPLRFLHDDSYAPQRLALSFIYLLMSWLSDGVVLYRFYRLHSGSKFTLPCVMIIVLALTFIGGFSLRQLASLGAIHWSNTSTIPGIAYLSLTWSIHVIFTAIIIATIFHHYSQTKGLIAGRSSRMYELLLEVICESAILYTVWMMGGVIACRTGSPIQHVILPPLGQVQAIPPLLIATRITAIERRRLMPTLSRRFSNQYGSPVVSPQKVSFSPGLPSNSEESLHQSVHSTAADIGEVKRPEPAYTPTSMV